MRLAVVVIGDAMITSASIADALDDQLMARYRLICRDWPAGVDDVVELNRVIERSGPNDVALPPLQDSEPDRVIGAVTHSYPRQQASSTAGRPCSSSPPYDPGSRTTTGSRSNGDRCRCCATRAGMPMRSPGSPLPRCWGTCAGWAKGHHLVRTGAWRPAVPLASIRELSGLTVGLVGCGAVGSLVARRLSGFEPMLLISDPWLTEDRVPAGASVVPLEDLLAEADVVSLHARSSADTFHLLGAAELNLVHPGAVIVNTARADLID